MDATRIIRHGIDTSQHLAHANTDIMATLDALKRTLRQKAIDTAPSLASSTQKLSDSQYASGFGILMQNQEWTTYQEFVIPQLSLILAPLFDSRPGTSILEVGPGPKSVLGYLPQYLRQKIRRYAAYEPNDLFASELEESHCHVWKDHRTSNEPYSHRTAKRRPVAVSVRKSLLKHSMSSYSATACTG